MLTQGQQRPAQGLWTKRIRAGKRAVRKRVRPSRFQSKIELSYQQQQVLAQTFSLHECQRSCGRRNGVENNDSLNLTAITRKEKDFPTALQSEAIIEKANDRLPVTQRQTEQKPLTCSRFSPRLKPLKHLLRVKFSNTETCLTSQIVKKSPTQATLKPAKSIFAFMYD